MINWFRWVIWHPISTWVPAKIFQLRYGFDYRDCWNLDQAMAKWLVPRLRHMAKVTHSYPGRGKYDLVDGHEEWVHDLLAVASALEEHQLSMFSDDWVAEKSSRARAHDAVKWIAEWWPDLWD